jgi:hypothetical protein
MKKHYETHVEDTDKLISVAGPELDYKSWYEQYRKLMEEQAQRKYGLYTPTSEGDEDDFPSIPGMIARYSALGLTNEQMKENPVWVDKTGNGHDLQMKNFLWGEMSGVGGYVQNFNNFKNNATVDKVRIDEQSSNSIKVTILTTGISNAIYIPKNIYQFNKSYSIKISSEGYNEGDLSLSFYASSVSTATTVKVPLNPNGITEIPAIKEDDFLAVYLNVGGKVGSITIEQLPLYPGALVFDGVDDYGVCDNFPILTKEKGYTVVALRQWITYNPNAISAIATNASDRSFNGVFTFENYNKGAEQTISYGATQITLQYSKSPFSWQTTSKYNGVNIANGNKDATNSLVLGRSYPQRNEFANFAIWELVFLDHDATEEELTKIKDYFVKTYPWLFPDQAWTVVGKTNEDEDRATIANITGNGNNLVLSNFGFAEGSGYNEEGEYAGYLVTDGVDDKIISSIFKMGNDWTVIGDWELINTGKNDNAGIVKFDSIVIYNYNSTLINIKNGRNILIPDQNTVNAICSDGRIYSKDWKESIYNEETESTSKNFLTIGYSGNAYTKIAFKNLAIYPTVLSREDCIKAYNYLQTLKAK